MNEELKNILSRVDHTLLAQGATWNEIKAICDDGIKYGEKRRVRGGHGHQHRLGEGRPVRQGAG